MSSVANQKDPNFKWWCSLDDPTHVEYLDQLYQNPAGDERIRIVVFGYQDFANVMTCIAAAVNKHSTKYQMRTICTIPHPFKYFPPHSFDFDPITEKNLMKEYVEKAEIAIWAEECVPGNYYSFYSPGQIFMQALTYSTQLFKRPEILKLVWHAGCPYRDRTAFYQSEDPKNFDAALFSPDLYPARWENPDNFPIYSLFGRPFPDDYPKKDLIFPFPEGHKLTFMHSPTNYYLKGTEVIRKTMQRLQEKYSFVEYKEIGGPHHEGKSVPADQIAHERLAGDIYIDQVCFIGGIGQSSLEAMKSGLLALCTVQNVALQNIPADCPLIKVPHYYESYLQSNSFYGLLEGLVEIYQKHPGQIYMMQDEAREWVDKNLSEEVYAQNFIQLLEKIALKKEQKK